MSPKDRKGKLIGLLQASVAAFTVDSPDCAVCAGVESTCLSSTHTLGAHLTGELTILAAKTSTLTFKAFTILLWQNYGPNMQNRKDALNREEHA